MGFRWAVTGANGFLGSAVIRELAGARHDVIAIVRPGADTWRLAGLDVGIVESSLTCTELTARTPRGFTIDVLVHLAAGGTVGELEPAAAVDNVAISLETAQWAKQAGARTVLHCGSAAEYGFGHLVSEGSLKATGARSVYAASKAASRLLAEAWLREEGIKFTTLIPFNVFGPYESPQRLIPQVVLGGLRGGAVPVTTGEQERDWIYVGDVARAFRLAGESSDLPSVLNVCSGRPLSVAHLLGALQERLPQLSLRVGELPHRPADQAELTGSPDLVRRVLGWQNTALEDGLHTTIEWFARNAHSYPIYESG